MSPRWFLVPPALVPLAIDVSLTLAMQSAAYWSGDLQLAVEANPVGKLLLTWRPAAFVVATIAYAILIAAAIRWAPTWIARPLSFGFLIAHSSGANSWLGYHGLWEPLHNVAIAGLAAGCWSLYLRALRREDATRAGKTLVDATLDAID